MTTPPSSAVVIDRDQVWQVISAERLRVAEQVVWDVLVDEYALVADHPHAWRRPAEEQE